MRGFFALLMMAVLALPLQAAEPRSLGTFKGWKALSYKEAGRSVCYMIAHPAKQEFKSARTKKNKAAPLEATRGEIHFMISLRPAESLDPVVSFAPGYVFKSGSEARLRIDKEEFSLFTAQDSAWARNSALDKRIVAALRKGTVMAVKGFSDDGATSLDAFALEGASGAYKAIASTCGIVE